MHKELLSIKRLVDLLIRLDAIRANCCEHIVGNVHCRCMAIMPTNVEWSSMEKPIFIRSLSTVTFNNLLKAVIMPTQDGKLPSYVVLFVFRLFKIGAFIAVEEKGSRALRKHKS